MGFLAPWFLAGIAAVGLPIYIHLLRQHKSIPLPFSSLMFFERRTQSSIKHRRLKYLLLLALRLLLLLLLALAFANPYIRRTAAPASDGRKLLVVAVDRSFSMRAGNRFDTAKQQAVDTLSEFRPGDLAQVIAFDSHVELLTQPIDSVPELRAAIRSISQGDGRSAYGEISRTLRSIGQASKRPVEAHVFSDMQRSSLPSPFSELGLAANTRLRLHAPAEAMEPNWFVESVKAPATIYQAKKVRVQATIAGAGTPAAERKVEVLLNGRTLDSKQVKVPASGRMTVEFFLNDAPYGLNRGEVRIAPGDALAQDDKFFFALERKEAGRVLFVHEARQGNGALYYRTALDSAPNAAFTLEAVTTDQVANISPTKYSFVVLSDVASLPSSFEDSLKKHVQGGGSVLIALGPVAATRPRVPIAGEPVLESRYAARGGDRFQMATSLDASHPTIHGANRMDGVKFYHAVRVDAGSDRVIARLSDQTPLLIDKKIGEGRAIVYTSTFDNVSNDFPLHTSFVPFAEETAEYLSGIGQTPSNYPVDSYMELRTAKDTGASVEVLDPDGKRSLSLQESASAQTFRVSREGYYEIRRSSGRHEIAAVHADRRESDLGTIPTETLALWQGAGQVNGNGGAGQPSEPKPYSLWWYFVFALFLVALLESWIASRYLAVENEVVARKEAA
ncbi:MAG TPA: BatA and WFA domain-containing protein [Bryobacteraceae bacterium]|nr:BatA and WFA domain-containing protein [Bryobacteraceae bacterium]